MGDEDTFSDETGGNKAGTAIASGEGGSSAREEMSDSEEEADNGRVDEAGTSGECDVFSGRDSGAPGELQDGTGGSKQDEEG